MTEGTSSYRSILKATSLFGGVQVFNIIIAIIKSKFVAVLIGPTGMGIYGLLTSTTQIISNFTNFGLQTSAVRSVSKSFEMNDSRHISLTICVLKRLVWLTGALGLIITLLLSPVLSFVCFKNHEYSLSFACLSITLLISQLSIGQNVILQGTRKWKLLAKSNLFGSFFGLLFSLPLYYFFRLDGIVPAVILASFFTLIFSWIYSKNIPYAKIQLRVKDIFTNGKEMLLLGLALSSSGIITLIGSYITRIFIARLGSIADVGLYTAGFAIINTYVGMVLTAMSTDYFPRLAGISSDNTQCKLLINKQSQIILLLITPLLIAFFIFSDFALTLLYSEKFLPVSGMVKWAAFGMFFRAISWCLSFLFPAKGKSKIFFVNELICNIYYLSFSLIGYYYKGLNGLGYAFAATYIIYTIQCFFVSKNKYEFNYINKFIKQAIIQFIFLALCFSLCFLDSKYKYLQIFCEIIILISSSIYSLLKLKYLVASKK